ncbi:MAG: 4-(cytidine 5'-diphospho)-2-C-methyl-D-erythritol kinase [Chitinispirillaceae bacterium]|nr:4-(cytidine 5'-diphospho)-2-C-methyl-D-erythritol kinase [Chitinispirillaceae bacterium]
MLERKSYTRVTLALDIVRKIERGRYAGYHELGTVKHQIDLYDTVTVENAPADLLECDDPLVPCDGRNVCMKVAALLKQEYSIDRHVRISIAKRIPVMGGLAGGSANAAATLDLLNELWDLGLSPRKRMDLAARIGMDVPYYFLGKTAFDAEAGGRLEPVSTDLCFDFVLAVPDFGVATKDAYAGIDYAAAGKQVNQTGLLCQALAANDRPVIPKLMHNDFEPSVFARFPHCARIKQELLDAGCMAALLTGSGSTVIGLARDKNHAAEVAGRVSFRTLCASTLVSGQ